MGELMDVLDPALSSARRSKKDDPVAQASTDTGRAPQQRDPVSAQSAGVRNPAYGADVMEKATREGWSLPRFRERIIACCQPGDLSWAATHLRHCAKRSG